MRSTVSQFSKLGRLSDGKKPDAKSQRDAAVEGIIGTLHAAGERSVKERNRMEGQLEEECRRLTLELGELKATRKRLLKENNRLHL